MEAYESSNRLQSAGGESFGYDDEGQMTSAYGQSYTFDAAYRLTNINGSTTQFFYDGRGNRLQAVRNGIVTRYIYDAAGNLLAEANGNNNITRFYIYGSGLLAMVDMNNELYTYNFDATGNTTALTQGKTLVNVYSYDAYGNVISQNETIPQPFKYVGQFGVMAEDSGLYYMRARYYDPKIGRFVSEDPIGFSGGAINLYEYVGNQPVNFRDPMGLYWVRQPWQTPGVVGRPNTPVPPGGPISEFIEKYVPAGYTFGEIHDAFVDAATRAGLPDWLVNIPSMIPMYNVAKGVEVLRSLGVLDQPKPKAKTKKCK